jgi:hypothetical protein
MNLFRVGCFAVALLSIAASGDPCDDTGSSGTGTVTTVGANGAACASESSEGIDGTPCCGSVNDPCQNDYECCTGSCSGSVSDGGAFASDGGGSTCGDPAVPTCTIALSSRCNAGQCECTTSDDCCLGVCAPTAIEGTGPSTTLRCCLSAGQPCGANADCCDLTCDPDSDQCD